VQGSFDCPDLHGGAAPPCRSATTDLLALRALLHTGFALFLDSGTVWDTGVDKRVRVAAGFGFHSDPFFMTLGFPLNTDDVRAVFTTGVRFGGIGMRKY